VATLNLKNLKCIITEDRIGADDPYLHVNGTKVWGPIKARAGDDLIINEHIKFKSKAIIELWEQDIDPDDHLGTHIISNEDLGSGAKTLKFTENGADYELSYEVLE
jgi:hypothetical protein